MKEKQKRPCIDRSADGLKEVKKQTRYFFNLEKRNCTEKVIMELEDVNGEVFVDEKQILATIESFYKDLYSSKISASEVEFSKFTHNINFPQLPDDEREQLEGPPTLKRSLKECQDVLSSFNDGKSPGEDGFTIEFYNQFFGLVGNDLAASLNCANEKGQLSISQRRGIITLIPKQESSLLDLKNWRPITLLNNDYKIASKAIAKRIEAVLPRLIHTDQTGFIKGRYIGENIRLISDLLEQTKTDKMSGRVMSMDFRKAFDTLEWPFMHYALKLYNFGESIRRWI